MDEDVQRRISEELNGGADDSIVIATPDNIHLVTSGYISDGEIDPSMTGDISKVFINGRSLKDILDGQRASLTNVAHQTKIAVQSASNMQDLKEALVNFLEAIEGMQ